MRAPRRVAWAWQAKCSASVAPTPARPSCSEFGWNRHRRHGWRRRVVVARAVARRGGAGGMGCQLYRVGEAHMGEGIGQVAGNPGCPRSPLISERAAQLLGKGPPSSPLHVGVVLVRDRDAVRPLGSCSCSRRCQDPEPSSQEPRRTRGTRGWASTGPVLARVFFLSCQEHWPVM
jgi:hypothetical protein